MYMYMDTEIIFNQSFTLSSIPYSVVVQKQSFKPPQQWKSFQFADVIFRQVNCIKLILKEEKTGL